MLPEDGATHLVGVKGSARVRVGLGLACLLLMVRRTSLERSMVERHLVRVRVRRLGKG